MSVIQHPRIHSHVATTAPRRALSPFGVAEWLRSADINIGSLSRHGQVKFTETVLVGKDVDKLRVRVLAARP